MAEEIHRGLEGVVVGESELSHIDGDAGELVYRGYAIEDLAREASYEEVLHLLWHGRLPDREELDAFSESMAAERGLSEATRTVVEELAAADERPMAALRSVVSTLSAGDPDADAGPEDREANLRKGRRIVATLPTALAAFTRLKAGEEPVGPREDLDHATNFLYMLNGEAPADVFAETFDMALVLHADHGLNASTFAARVTASTLADLHSAVTSAVGTLGGSLHGGANQDVMRMLLEVGESDRDPVGWVRKALEEDRRIPGFGHRVYNVKDPRAKILAERSKALGEEGEMKWYDYSTAIEEHLAEEKELAPNVDFYSASTYYQMDVPIETYSPIFALSRAGGWIAHVFEQCEDNRLIRPRARYAGERDREFVPIDER
jgi:citrate synthase